MQVFMSELTNLLLSSSDMEKLCKQTVCIEVLSLVLLLLYPHCGVKDRCTSYYMSISQICKWKYYLKGNLSQAVVALNPSTWKAEASGSL